MRHLKPALVVPCALALVLTSGVASRATSGQTVISTTGLPAGFSSLALTCDDQQASTYGETIHTKGPGTPPLGSGSLELTTTGEQYLIYTAPGTPAASSLTAMSVADSNPGGDGNLTLNIILNDVETGQNQGFDELVATLPDGASWSTTDLLTMTLDTYHYTSATDTYSTDVPQTYAQFLTAHPGSTLSGFQFDDVGCSAPTQQHAPSLPPAYIDDIQFGLDNTTTTYNFEAGPKATVTVSSAKTITRGSSVTIGGVLSVNHTPIVDAPITLYDKPARSTTWTLDYTTTSGAKGKLFGPVTPTGTTTYRWVFDGNAAAGPATSAASTVSIGSQITLDVVSASVPHGGSLVAFGSIIPAKSGVTVSVYDKSGKHVKLLGHTKTRRDSTWGFSARLSRGKHSVYAKVAAHAGNVGGTSKPVSVRAH
jgi:hypothetical protein